MPKHDATRVVKHQMTMNEVLVHTRFGCWVQRAYYVPAKRRAMIQAFIGLAMCVISIYGAVVVGLLPDARNTPAWVSPAATYTPLYAANGAVGYAVNDPDYSLLCRKEKTGEDYTCQKLDLRR